MNISVVDKDKRSEALMLLKESQLPVDDITEKTILYSINENEKTVAVVGLETYGDAVLLRSLCVSDQLRGRGKGSALILFFEEQVIKQGISDVYLLTETAAPLFEKMGYQIIEREVVPSSIKSTSQFGSVCPTTATVMYKKLSL